MFIIKTKRRINKILIVTFLSSGEHCVELRKKFPYRNTSKLADRFFWADRNCKNAKNFYICEKPPGTERVKSKDCLIDLTIRENYSCYLNNRDNAENYTECQFEVYTNNELQVSFEIHKDILQKNCYVFLKSEEKLTNFVSINSNNTVKKIPPLFSDKNITKTLFLTDEPEENYGFRLFLLSKNYIVILKSKKIFLYNYFSD